MPRKARNNHHRKRSREGKRRRSRKSSRRPIRARRKLARTGTEFPVHYWVAFAFVNLRVANQAREEGAADRR